MRWGDLRPLIENHSIKVMLYTKNGEFLYSTSVIEDDYDVLPVNSIYFKSNLFTNILEVKCDVED